jgi:DNA repair photolyase
VGGFGCAYCYARPTHEYLGLDAGLDFETKIFVKHRAPALFRNWLARESWQPEYIAFSGVTDCYQPAELKYNLTRGCLEVALDARQPIGVITKNAMVTRDIEALAEMARFHIISVSISITTLNAKLAATMEPRTSAPHARLRAIRELSEAGVPVTAMDAPIIPGLTDSEVPAILEAVAAAGATSASYIVLRLPWNVRPVFLEWLART